jgi:hypothetical protein
MIELSRGAIRSEINRLKAAIRQIEASRVEPFDAQWHELLNTDWEAARSYGDQAGRTAACYEIEGLWVEIDHLNDALRGRRPRDVTLN